MFGWDEIYSCIHCGHEVFLHNIDFDGEKFFVDMKWKHHQHLEDNCMFYKPRSWRLGSPPKVHVQCQCPGFELDPKHWEEFLDTWNRQEKEALEYRERMKNKV